MVCLQKRYTRTKTNGGNLHTAATDQQDTRRMWIVGHWPHVVEYQEVNRAMTTDEMVETPLVANHEITGITDSLASAIDM